ERQIGQGPIHERLLAAAQVRAPGAVEAQDGARREAPEPERVGVAQAGEVELLAPVLGTEAREVAPVHAGARRREAGQVESRWRVPLGRRSAAYGGSWFAGARCGG